MAPITACKTPVISKSRSLGNSYREAGKNYRAEAVAAGNVRMVFCWVMDNTPVPASRMIAQAQELLDRSSPGE